MFRHVSALTAGHLQGARKLACAAYSKMLNELPEDGQQLMPKHVTALINKKENVRNELVLNFHMYVT
jgi:hypothetical protein